MAAATTLANISLLLLGEGHSRPSAGRRSKKMPAANALESADFLKKKSEFERLS
jgi:hypothetical protein